MMITSPTSTTNLTKIDLPREKLKKQSLALSKFSKRKTKELLRLSNLQQLLARGEDLPKSRLKKLSGFKILRIFAQKKKDRALTFNYWLKRNLRPYRPALLSQ